MLTNALTHTARIILPSVNGKGDKVQYDRDKYLRAIAEKWGGFTISAQEAIGGWINADGTLIQEVVVLVDCDTPITDSEFWETLALQLKQDARQESVYLRLDNSVYFV